MKVLVCQLAPAWLCSVPRAKQGSWPMGVVGLGLELVSVVVVDRLQNKQRPTVYVIKFSLRSSA